jgi:hypothetical protein
MENTTMRDEIKELRLQVIKKASDTSAQRLTGACSPAARRRGTKQASRRARKHRHKHRSASA